MCALLYTKEVKQTVIFGQYKKHSLIVKEEMSIKFSVFYASLIVESRKINLVFSDIIFLFYEYKGLVHSTLIYKKKITRQSFAKKSCI